MGTGTGAGGLSLITGGRGTFRTHGTAAKETQIHTRFHGERERGGVQPESLMIYASIITRKFSELLNELYYVYLQVFNLFLKPIIINASSKAS